MVFPNYAVYGATKAGLTQLSAMLRAELGGRGVRVTDVQPGLTETELGTHVTDPAGRQLLESMFEQMTALRAEDVAEVVLHAISRPPHVNISTVTVVPTQQW
jgi:NADP-dependent 3-hydroxy acid dehydrogenase YdfG